MYQCNTQDTRSTITEVPFKTLHDHLNEKKPIMIYYFEIRNNHLELFSGSLGDEQLLINFTWPSVVYCTDKPVFRGQLNIRNKISLHNKCPFVTGYFTWGR